MDNIAVWLDRVQYTCQQYGQNSMDIIIDQCGLGFSVIPALAGFSPAIQWCSLYKGLPEDIYQEDAPLLVRIELEDEQQVRWMYDLAREVQFTAPLLVIGSFWTLPSLSEWLGQCTDASHEGRAGIFRFWDTRIFPYLFSDILAEKDKNQLHQPALFWSWMDRDNQPALLMGNGAFVDNEVSQKITFSDAQFEALMCLCDTKRFLEYGPVRATLFPTREAMFSASFNAMLAATKQGLLFAKERDSWVIERLIQQKNQA